MTIPRVSDGIVFRVLQNLLILDGERLSYRMLDVEQIGSVYEVMMGFGIGIAEGPTIAIKAKKPLGAPRPINLEELLAVAPGERGKWLVDNTDQNLTGDAAAALKNAKDTAGLMAALDRKIAKSVTPTPISKGGMVPIPSDERRRSGSNYTPRTLTEPIVRKTLEPILKRLGDDVTPDQILDLKICDPAMGSGAFLVEACRQLADVLVKSWQRHKAAPAIPPDEDEILHARRIIAQRCLYGVDRNPMAVDLAKLSLWLATLAKDHPFTFLDHSFRAGDSLVGLTLKQIKGFYWKPTTQTEFRTQTIDDRVSTVQLHRQEILTAGDFMPFEVKRVKLAKADEELNLVRFIGDLAVAAFFGAEKDKARQKLRGDYLAQLAEYLRTGDMSVRPGSYVESLRAGKHPVVPFHWEIEFPEVFARDDGGFDGIVGNPPFAGVVQIAIANGEVYTEFLRTMTAGSRGKTDLVAYFYRRAFQLIREGGAQGLIGTNTVAQGDTRASGLTPIREAGGVIFSAVRRLRWPGQASVIVSVVHIGKINQSHIVPELDGEIVPQITAFLFSNGPDRILCPCATSGTCVASKGIVPYGMGFVFEDENDACTPVAAYAELVSKYPANTEVIHRFLGGEDLNSLPSHSPDRFIIDFLEMDESRARQYREAFQVVEKKVKPTRSRLTTQSNAEWLRNNWWLFAFSAKEFRQSASPLSRVLVTSQTSKYRCFTFVPSDWVLDQKVIGFARGCCVLWNHAIPCA